MKSRNFRANYKPETPKQPVVAVPQGRPHSVLKDEVLPRLGIFAFLAGFTVMSGLNNVMKNEKF